ncbi:uncharacterized protein NEMAJ01_1562 [Nematocida major]|uniref:uncharacterized protein n=1 Tax=Nematocida major TaxID=1912982 RepID=UPI00200820E5|nr:uncharacterized protein NEMAJ01_1562 [Nematocida major]KAH9386666.1 hypothetical protein NEMAJ01_1562 [Nematocida major]
MYYVPTKAGMTRYAENFWAIKGLAELIFRIIQDKTSYAMDGMCVSEECLHRDILALLSKQMDDGKFYLVREIGVEHSSMSPEEAERAYKLAQEMHCKIKETIRDAMHLLVSKCIHLSRMSISLTYRHNERISREKVVIFALRIWIVEDIQSVMYRMRKTAYCTL